MHWILKLFLGLLLLAVAVIIVYLLYVLISYKRIPDGAKPELLHRARDSKAATGVRQTVTTYNVGFGAYSPKFSFFMDDGTYSRAISRADVLRNMAGMQAFLEAFPSDYVLLQEVDFGSTRSYQLNEKEIFENTASLLDFDSSFAVNYDSPYLFWPVKCPHGRSRSGLLSFSRYPIETALRRSLPLQSGFSKLLDLDRCYVKQRIPTETGHDLVLYHFHLSAYASDESLSLRQLKRLLGDMQEEYWAGNYCLAGGDFNKDLLGWSGDYFESNGEKHSGALAFPFDIVPDGLRVEVPYDPEDPVPSCRNAHEPYQKGHTYVQTIDGFIVSENIRACSAKVMDTGFAYSDHNPVRMSFILD